MLSYPSLQPMGFDHSVTSSERKWEMSGPSVDVSDQRTVANEWVSLGYNQ